jgi:acyl-CoA ligase (AMP-forming) (exosortase A-associated)
VKTSIHHVIEQQLVNAGHSPALTYRNESLTYGELWDQVDRAGAMFTALGVEREDRVAIFLEKRVETVVAMFGASVAGAAFVPINPILKPAQVAHILSDCSVRVLVTSPNRLALLVDSLLGCPDLEQIVLVGDEAPADSSDPATRPTHNWATALAAADAGTARSLAIDHDVAAVLYTSGSTGLPKGVVLSHRNLIVGAESVSDYLRLTREDVILSVLPLSFDAGLSQLTTTFDAGGHVVLLNFLVPADVPRMCARHGVTGLTCVPPLWIQIADLTWPTEAVEHLRFFANTGGRMPKTVLGQLRATFPAASPYLMYGLTEAFRSTYLDPGEVDRRPDSIGKAIPNAEILVVRPDGSPCDPGEAGELVHRGALVAQGYWGDPKRTAERFRPVPGRTGAGRMPEIAVWSGDTVVADEEGFLYFVGRNDEMIKTSGYRVSPAEIEEAAYDTGMLRDVVALGLEDARLGQHIVLVLTPKNDVVFEEAVLLKALRVRLPTYMLPHSIILREGIPRSPNGKFDRAAIRAAVMS